MNILIALAGLIVVGGGLVYGCSRIAPGGFLRWPLYGVCSCVVVGAVWLKILPLVGLSQPTPIEQIIGMVVVILALKAGMERVIGYWL